MKIIGWIGILHIFVIILWIVINLIFHQAHPVSMNEHESLAEMGIAFYSNFPGYLGFDHGSKALIMLLSITIPIAVFIFLQRLKNFQLQNLIALLTGCLGFFSYSVSLMVQAVTVEYAFQLYRSAEDAFSRQFAIYLYEWAMLEGGLSVSMYIIANILLATWVLIHSYGMYSINGKKCFVIYGMFTGIAFILGHLFAWFFLMRGEQNIHTINEIIGGLFLGWILIISIPMVRGKRLKL